MCTHALNESIDCFFLDRRGWKQAPPPPARRCLTPLLPRQRQSIDEFQTPKNRTQPCCLTAAAADCPVVRAAACSSQSSPQAAEQAKAKRPPSPRGVYLDDAGRRDTQGGARVARALRISTHTLHGHISLVGTHFQDETPSRPVQEGGSEGQFVN